MNQRTDKQYRLPTGNEWEYACQGGKSSKHCGGDNPDAVAWYSANAKATVNPVGQKQANGYGLHDMSGNVWEWVEDCWEDDCEERTFRGGAWSSYPYDLLPTAAQGNKATASYASVGFRLARTISIISGISDRCDVLPTRLVVDSNSAKWNGSCSSAGYADGNGVVRWMVGEKEVAQFNGKLVQGEMSGDGSLVFSDGAEYQGTFLKNLPNGFGKLTVPSRHSLMKFYSSFTVESFRDHYDFNPNNQGRWDNDLQKYVLEGIYKGGVFLKSCAPATACANEGKSEGLFTSRFRRSKGKSKYEKDSDGNNYEEKQYVLRDTFFGENLTTQVVIQKTPNGLTSTGKANDRFTCKGDICKATDVLPYTYVGPQPIRLFATEALDSVSVDVPVSFPQWDVRGQYWKNGGFTTREMGIREIGTPIFVDKNYSNPKLERVLFVCRATVFYCEPAVGYIEKIYLMKYVSYVGSTDAALEIIRNFDKSRRPQNTPPKLWNKNQMLEAMNPEPVNRLALVDSPYNKVFPKTDIRRILKLGKKSGLEEYGFVRLVTRHGRKSCSAALVGNRRTLVTAGHCFDSADDLAEAIYRTSDGKTISRTARITKTPFFNKNEKRITDAIEPNKANGAYYLTDWAVLKLDEEFPESVLPLPIADYGQLLAPFAKPSPTFLLGYPGDLDNSAPSISPCGLIDVSNDFRVSFASNTDWMAPLLVDGCAAFQGNSGGPLIHFYKNQPHFIGVVSVGDLKSAIENCPKYITSDSKTYLATRLNGDDQFSASDLKHRLDDNKLSKFDIELLRKTDELLIVHEKNPDLYIDFDNKDKNQNSLADRSGRCAYKKYISALTQWKEVILSTSKYMLDSIEEANGTPSTQTKQLGINYFGEPHNGTMLHTRSFGLMGLMPDKLNCVFRGGPSVLLEGKSITTINNDDGYCDVTKRSKFAFRITKDSPLAEYGFGAYKGALVIFDPNSGNIVHAYSGVLERCMADRYLCQLHITLPNLPR